MLQQQILILVDEQEKKAPFEFDSSIDTETGRIYFRDGRPVGEVDIRVTFDVVYLQNRVDLYFIDYKNKLEECNVSRRDDESR